MDFLRETLRGVAAAVAAFGVMGVVAAGALAAMGTPVSGALVAAVMAAALGAPAALTGTVEAGAIGAVVHGSVDVAPLGVLLPGLVILGAGLLGRRAASMRVVAARAGGAMAVTAAVTGGMLAAGAATVPVPLPAAVPGTALPGAAVPGSVAGPRDVALVVRPDAGAAVLGALMLLAVVAGLGLLMTRLPHRSVIATVALLGLLTPVIAGFAVAALAAPHRPAVAGAALLFGANALLVAGISPDGPLAHQLQDVTLLPGWLVVAVIALVTVAGAGLLALTSAGTREPGTRRRAARHGLVAGVTLAVVFAGLSAAAAGRVELGVAVLFFDAPILTLHLPAAVGWALLAGAAGGGAAGFVGSLIADARPRAHGHAAGVSARAHASERG